MTEQAERTGIRVSPFSLSVSWVNSSPDVPAHESDAHSRHDGEGQDHPTLGQDDSARYQSGCQGYATDVAYVHFGSLGRADTERTQEIVMDRTLVAVFCVGLMVHRLDLLVEDFHGEAVGPAVEVKSLVAEDIHADGGGASYEPTPPSFTNGVGLPWSRNRSSWTMNGSGCHPSECIVCLGLAIAGTALAGTPAVTGGEGEGGGGGSGGRYEGCRSGGYHLPSDASHQSGPCDTWLMSRYFGSAVVGG